MNTYLVITGPNILQAVVAAVGGTLSTDPVTALQSVKLLDGRSVAVPSLAGPLEAQNTRLVVSMIIDAVLNPLPHPDAPYDIS